MTVNTDTVKVYLQCKKDKKKTIYVYPIYHISTSCRNERMVIVCLWCFRVCVVYVAGGWQMNEIQSQHKQMSSGIEYQMEKLSFG